MVEKTSIICELKSKTFFIFVFLLEKKGERGGSKSSNYGVVV